MQLIYVIFALNLMALLMAGCGTSSQSRSQTTSIAEHNNADNVAVIFQGIGAGLLQRDLQQIGDLFRTDLEDQNFNVIEKYDVNASDMIASLKAASRLVGDRGTLVIYYGGHGLKGELETGEEKIKFTDIAKALRENRLTPIKRIIFFVQSCYSGTAVPSLQDMNEFSAAAASKMKEDLDWFNDNIEHFPNFKRLEVDRTRLEKSNLPGESITINGEVVVVTAVSADQLAVGSGRISDTEGGPFFSHALLHTWRDLNQNNHATATLGDLINRTAHLQKNYSASGWLQQDLQSAYSHLYLKDELLFAESGNKENAVWQQKVALASQWSQELIDGVNEKFKNCKISINDSQLEGDSSFFFSPTFNVADSDGHIDVDVFLGTYNWMSNPAISIEVVTSSLIRRYKGGTTFSCQLL